MEQVVSVQPLSKKLSLEAASLQRQMSSQFSKASYYRPTAVSRTVKPVLSGHSKIYKTKILM